MRKFHLGDLISITTGHLYSPTKVDGVYEILNYMTSDNLFTHQLPRAAEEAAPYLFEQHPWLREITEADLTLPEGVKGEAAWAMAYEKLAKLVEKYGEYHDVRPMRKEDHEVIDPIEEARRMAPHAKIIAIDGSQGPSPYGDIDWRSEQE